MKRVLLAASAALALAACADAAPTASTAADPRFAGPAANVSATATGDIWTIFTNQTPGETLDASPGWEVATRFYSSVAGCVIGLRFRRALGETGSNVVKLWTNSGTELVRRTVAGSTDGAGWHEKYLYHPLDDDRVNIAANTYYRVSANTNTKQAKTYGVLDNGPIVNGTLTANLSYYGSTLHSMPTTSSGSIYFVDVIFQEGACP